MMDINSKAGDECTDEMIFKYCIASKNEKWFGECMCQTNMFSELDESRLTRLVYG